MATLGTGADSFIYKSPEFGPRRDFDPLGDLQRTNNELKRISDTVEAGRTRARLLDHYLPALVGGAMRPDTKQLEAAITTLNLSATVSPDAQGNWRISDDQAQKLSDVVQRTELIYKEGAISAQTRNNLVNAVSVVVDINTKTAKILASGPSTEQFNAADRALQGIQTSNQRLQDEVAAFDIAGGTGQDQLRALRTQLEQQIAAQGTAIKKQRDVIDGRQPPPASR